MYKYSDLRKYIDEKQIEYTDNIEHSRDYNMFCRMGQMYHELEYLKLSYEKVLEEDFKGNLIRQVYQAKQSLYNSKGGRKEDLIFGINRALEELDKITSLDKAKGSDK